MLEGEVGSDGKLLEPPNQYELVFPVVSHEVTPSTEGESIPEFMEGDEEGVGMTTRGTSPAIDENIVPLPVVCCSVCHKRAVYSTPYPSPPAASTS